MFYEVNSGHFSFYTFFLLILLILQNIELIEASLGDNLIFFRDCLNKCVSLNCSGEEKLRAFETSQPFHLWIFGWSCLEECKYGCQWVTVNYLLSQHFSFQRLPQFYGKWTFHRLWGIQEPASTLFSLLNLIANYFAWKKYCKKVLSISTKEKPNEIIDPYFVIITLNAVICINAWLWSTVFHIHDTPLTEKLDYFSAFSVVLFNFYFATIKVIEQQLNVVRSKITKLRLTTAVPFTSFYIYHVYLMSAEFFDYGYNMNVNLVVGFSAALLWLFWCFVRYGQFSSEMKPKYIYKAILCIIAVKLLLLLELIDFPPIAYVFDAHSLWHCGTIPIPFLWYSFLTDDALSYNNYYPTKQKSL